MAYETIIVETRGKVGLITLNRPKALNALNSQVLGGSGRALRGVRCRIRRSAPSCITGSEKAFAAGADIKEMQAKTYVEAYLEDFFVGWEELAPHPQADHRRGRRLCAGRRLRARHDVRFHHRRRQRQIRPAGNHARRHAGHGRVAAPDPLRRQVEGDGHVPDRPHDGCGRGRALRPGVARRAGRRARRRGAEGGGQDRRFLAAGRDDGEGGGQPLLRDDACRGPALRAPAVPFDVRARGPEGRHGGLCREAHQPISSNR